MEFPAHDADTLRFAVAFLYGFTDKHAAVPSVRVYRDMKHKQETEPQLDFFSYHPIAPTQPPNLIYPLFFVYEVGYLYGIVALLNYSSQKLWRSGENSALPTPNFENVSLALLRLDAYLDPDNAGYRRKLLQYALHHTFA